MKHKVVQRLAIGIVGFILIVLITACVGISTGGQPKNFTGSLVSVDAQHHSVTLSVHGQSVTIKGLTDQEVAALQGQFGEISSMISVRATQNSDGSYTLAAGPDSITFTVTRSSTLVVVLNGTPGPSSTPGASGNVGSSGPNEPGSISFTGTVMSVGNGSIMVGMPSGSTLSMAIINGQTDMSDFNGTLPRIGQLIKVDVSANASDGSFTATKLKPADSSDTTVDYTGVTTSTVEADNVIHFRIGKRDFSFMIVPGTTELKGFSTPQSIGSNVTVQVKVQFQGTTGTVQEVKSGNS